MSLREKLIATQRRLLAAVQRDIRAALGKQPAALRRYYSGYRRRFRRPFTPATREELLRACAAADIIFVGDYHTLAAAQRVPIQLIRALSDRGRRRWTLALEMLQVEDQTAANRYMAGEIDDEGFLRAIDYENAWGFPWPNFRRLFAFARETGARVIGINCNPKLRENSLEQRDICAAMAIAMEAKSHPDRKILVLDGDLHVALTHLPTRTAHMLHDMGIRRRWVIVYQNSETIHWRLVEQGRERETGIVRLGPREFCLQTTHPIAKYQSFLNWLEFEEELRPSMRGVLADEDDEEDAPRQVQRFVDTIRRTLEIRGDFTDFTVYTIGDLHYLDDLRDVHVYTNEEIDLVFIQILKGESHFLPEGNLIYLANLTVNHAAEEAAHYINAKLSGPAPAVDSPLDDFYQRTMREVLGFFGSKIINPQRLAYLDADFEGIARELHRRRVDVQRRDLRKITRHVLRHLEIERGVLRGKRRPPSRLPREQFREFSVYLGIVHALGYRLGTLLYAAFEKERIGTGEVRDLFSQPWREPGSAQAAYFGLLRRLQGPPPPEQAAERL